MKKVLFGLVLLASSLQVMATPRECIMVIRFCWEADLPDDICFQMYNECLDVFEQ